MNVSLGPLFEDFVASMVKSGAYQSNSEVVREALRLMRDREEVRRIRLEELRREVQKGLDDVDAGRVAPLDIEEIKREGRRLLAKRQREKR